MWCHTVLVKKFRDLATFSRLRESDEVSVGPRPVLAD